MIRDARRAAHSARCAQQAHARDERVAYYFADAAAPAVAAAAALARHHMLLMLRCTCRAVVYSAPRERTRFARHAFIERRS